MTIKTSHGRSGQLPEQLEKEEGIKAPVGKKKKGGKKIAEKKEKQKGFRK